MDRAGYRPLPETEDSFWRMKKLLAGLTSGRHYHSDSNPDYQPGDDVEEADWSEEEDKEEEEEQAETEGTADNRQEMDPDLKLPETDTDATLTWRRWRSTRRSWSSGQGGRGVAD